jgi:NAD(P)-dependent dehydrogenase (short-subunit alcohol dehydrogenase family)
MIMKALSSVFFYGRFLRPFSVLGFRRAQRHFQCDRFDFSNQRWIITGASGGLGRALALAANAMGAQVWALARSKDRLASLKDAAKHPARLTPVVCDLGPADVLVNNVGVLLDQTRLTEEGFELALATNLLGPVLLTRKLLAANALSPASQVINVSSGGMYGTALKLEAMTQPDLDGYDGVSAYAMHKRAMVSWTHHWNDTHPQGPVMQVMHPGWVKTPGVAVSLPYFSKIMKPLLRSPAQGIDTVLWLADERPPATGHGIWLDRALAEEHAFSMTQQSPVTVQDLAAYFDQTLSPWQ